MREAGYSRRFSFGPLERRGLAGGLRASQIGLLVIAALAALLILRAAPSGRGLLLAVGQTAALAAVAFVPVRGRTIEEWLPVVMRFRLARRSYRSRQPTGGYRAGLADADVSRVLTLPDHLDGCELLAVRVRDNQEIGVFADPSEGSLTAVLAVRVRAFGLLSEEEQERRLDRWGQALASLARTSGVVRRVQILERTVPADGDALQRYLSGARDRSQPDDGLPLRSYDALLQRAGFVTQDHELFLSVQVDERRAASRRGKGRDARETAIATLTREVQAFASRFDPADVQVEGVLPPRSLASVMRLAFDPFGRERLNRLGAAAEIDGADPQAFGPTATEEGWDTYRSDGALHRTYWVAQWPRLAVAPTFLAPLLLSADVVRSLSVVLEPVSPDRARRSVEAAITSDLADEELRASKGFRTTARRRKRNDAVLQRESELSSGHQEFRFAAYLTVSGVDDEGLQDACDQLEQAAHQAYLDVQPLWGQQAEGFVFGALPIARGLRPGSPLGGGS